MNPVVQHFATIPPKDAAFARDAIASLERECRSRPARKRMAELALGRHGNYTPEGKAVWGEYLATFEGAA